MNDADRLKILAEARAHLAGRTRPIEPVAETSIEMPPIEDEVLRWRREASETAAARARAQRDMRREERAFVERRQGEQEAINWTEIDRRIVLEVERRVAAAIKAILEAIGTINEDTNRAIGRAFDATDTRLASLEQMLNRRAGRRFPADEQGEQPTRSRRDVN